MSQSQWKKGDFAVRKGKLCQITHIDFTLDPPAVTVKMLEAGHEVGTEFSKIKRVESPKWSCPICTYDNNLSDNKCTVCEQGIQTKDIYYESLKKIETTLIKKEINEKNGIKPIEWQCTMCTFNNSMAFDSCQVCLTVRSPNAKLIYPDIPDNIRNNHNHNNNNSNNNNNNNNNNSNNSNQNENQNVNDNTNEMKSDIEAKSDDQDSQNNNNNNNNGNDVNDVVDDISTDSSSKNTSETDSNGKNNSELNDSDWTLIEKTDISDENDKNNDDPYLDVE